MSLFRMIDKKNQKLICDMVEKVDNWDDELNRL